MSFRTSWQNTTAANPIVVTVATQAHDYLIAVVESDSASGSPSWPGDFTQIADIPMTFDGARLGVAIKMDASGSEGTVSVGGGTWTGAVFAFSGRDNSSGSNFTVITNNNNTGQASAWSITVGPGTTTADGCDLIAILGSDNAPAATVTNAFSDDSGVGGSWTAINVSDTLFRNFGLGYKSQATAGSTGTVTCQGTGAGASAARAAVLLALKPAVVSGANVPWITA